MHKMILHVVLMFLYSLFLYIISILLLCTKQNSQYQVPLIPAAYKCLFYFCTAALNSAFAFSTVILDIMNVMIKVSTTGITRYIVFNILIQDSGCTANVPSYPANSSNQPWIATPIPPPSFTPKDVQEYIVPSTRFPFVRYERCDR